METHTLKAQTRESGKKFAQRLRREGQVPAVLYGAKVKEPRFLSVNMRELDQLVSKAGGTHGIFHLDIEGDKTKDLTVLIKDAQADMISRDFSHLDFMLVDLKQQVVVKVSIILTGKSEGEKMGGIVDHAVREIEVSCEAGNIPEKMEVDITKLDVGDAVHAKDLVWPEGTKLAHETNQTIVSVILPRAEVEKPEVEPVEGEEGAEGTSAEGAVATGAEKEDKKD
jgi:large subunit ribosomal protein L25